MIYLQAIAEFSDFGTSSRYSSDKETFSDSVTTYTSASFENEVGSYICNILTTTDQTLDYENLRFIVIQYKNGTTVLNIDKQNHGGKITSQMHKLWLVSSILHAYAY